LVADQLRNIFIFRRNLKPTNETEKYKLDIIAQINTGEVVTCCILGSINMNENFDLVPHFSDRTLFYGTSSEELSDERESSGE